MKLLLLLCCTLLLTQNAVAQSEKKALSMEEKTFHSASGREVKGEMGSLMVPENRDNPGSEKIAIHFARLKKYGLIARYFLF